MRNPLEHTGNVPLYRQIENHLRQNIRSDGLTAEMRLPYDGVPGLSIRLTFFYDRVQVYWRQL